MRLPSAPAALERHLAEARLPPGKTLDTFDFEAVPVVSKAQVVALAAGDGAATIEASTIWPPIASQPFARSSASK